MHRTFGARPKDPSTVQRVDRQRVAGTDPDDIIVRKSKDYERKISANKVTPDFTVESGKPLDWAVLMGTNERKVSDEELRKIGGSKYNNPIWRYVRINPRIFFADAVRGFANPHITTTLFALARRT